MTHRGWMTAVVVVLACAKPAPAPDLEGARTALRASHDAYWKDGLAKNKDAFLAHYADDAAVYPPGGESVQGSAALAAFMDPFFKDPAFAGTVGEPRVEVLGDGTVGTVVADVDLTTTGADGKPATEHMRDFHVLRRQADGSWKLTVDIWNALPAPAAPAKK